MTHSAHLALAAATSFACLVGTADAQARHVFSIDAAQSSFNLSGSVGLGAITGNINPVNFNVSGAASADLTNPGGSITAGQLVPGNNTIVTVPALSTRVPGPFGSTLLNINLTQSQATFTSNQFAVAPNGAFTATVTANILAGMVNVTGLASAMVDLTGTTSSPTMVSGTLQPSSDGLDLSVPITSTFTFTDPGTGATGNLRSVARSTPKTSRSRRTSTRSRWGSAGPSR